MILNNRVDLKKFQLFAYFLFFFLSEVGEIFFTEKNRVYIWNEYRKEVDILFLNEI